MHSLGTCESEDGYSTQATRRHLASGIVPASFRSMKHPVSTHDRSNIHVYANLTDTIPDRGAFISDACTVTRSFIYCFKYIIFNYRRMVVWYFDPIVVMRRNEFIISNGMNILIDLRELTWKRWIESQYDRIRRAFS